MIGALVPREGAGSKYPPGQPPQQSGKRHPQLLSFWLSPETDHSSRHVRRKRGPSGQTLLPIFPRTPASLHTCRSAGSSHRNDLLPAAALAGPLRQGKQPAGAGKHQQQLQVLQPSANLPRGNRHRNPLFSPLPPHPRCHIPHPSGGKASPAGPAIHLAAPMGIPLKTAYSAPLASASISLLVAANQFIPVSAGGFHPLQAIFRKCAQHCNLFHDTLRSPSVLFDTTSGSPMVFC